MRIWYRLKAFNVDHFDVMHQVYENSVAVLAVCLENVGMHMRDMFNQIHVVVCLPMLATHSPKGQEALICSSLVRHRNVEDLCQKYGLPRDSSQLGSVTALVLHIDVQ